MTIIRTRNHEWSKLCGACFVYVVPFAALCSKCDHLTPHNPYTLGQAQITIFLLRFYGIFFTILRRFFYDFVTMLREHSLPYLPMFSLVFKPKNWQQGQGRCISQ